MSSKITTRWLRILGECDARAGKPIEAFYDVEMPRHNETMRAQYEIGYRATKSEMRKEQNAKNKVSGL